MPNDDLSKLADRARRLMEEALASENPPNCLRSRPKWVPDWVWRAYLRDRGYRPVIDRVVRSFECKTVWKAIEKHVETPDQNDAHWLFTEVDKARRFPKVARMTGAERKAKEETVTRAIQKIRAAIEEIRPESNHLLSFGSGPMLTGALEESERRGLFDEDTSDYVVLKTFQQAGEVFAIQLVQQLDGLLAAVMEDFRSWARQETIVGRPSRSTAEKIYFVRHMEQFFKDRYQAELPTAAKALAAAVLDC